jgi:hypothetical protein
MEKMKIRMLFFVLIAFAVSAQAQTRHTIRNQVGENVLVEISNNNNGVREYLAPGKTSTHFLYGQQVTIRVTVDYTAPVQKLVNLRTNGEFIDINDQFLGENKSSSPTMDLVEPNGGVYNQNKSDGSKSSSIFTTSRDVLFINTTSYKIVGKTGAVKGLILMPGDSLVAPMVRINDALEYNILEGSYQDVNGTVIKPEEAQILLSLYNSSAKIKSLDLGLYEENFKMYLTESAEQDQVGLLLILQFKIDKHTNYVIIDKNEVKRNKPHGETRQRDVINKSDQTIQLTVGGAQVVIPPGKGRRFKRAQMAEELQNGYYYLTVSLISGGKAIQRDLLLLISEDQRHFIITQNDVSKAIRADYQGQGF